MDIEFFFDVGSPYSYLAATRIPELEQKSAQRVRWRPLLIGGVFKATGNTMPAQVASKARWMLQDLQRWARYYGVEFRFPSQFPLNTLIAQRVLTALELDAPQQLPSAAITLFRSYWVEDRDVSSPDTLIQALKAVHPDPAQLIEAAGTPRIKEALLASSNEAVNRGAFGAPTFFVGDQMFWGNDRLHFVAEAAAAR